MPGEEDQKGRYLPFLELPLELQRAIVAYALDCDGIDRTTVLRLSRDLYALARPLLYADVRLSSIRQARLFVEAPSASSERTTCEHTRAYTFTLAGVPGGSVRGGRESTPVSPTRASTDKEGGLASNDRLLLAARGALRCPNLLHYTLEMFGVRHSTFLTSADYLAEEANAFRSSLAQCRSLRSFAWIIPRANYNFIGVSVAVVDLAIPPMIEGLLAAATDMDPSGRRVQHARHSLNRFMHPLRSITLHHCIFPATAYPNESFFRLFAQTHPDDDHWLLFPCLERIVIRTANNVNPTDVAMLALTWQLRLDPSLRSSLTPVERHQLEHADAAQDPRIILSDTFISSIWGPRVEQNTVRRCIEALVAPLDHLETDMEAAPPSTNPIIRILEESADARPTLASHWKERLALLNPQQRARLIDRAVARVEIAQVADAIAGHQAGVGVV